MQQVPTPGDRAAPGPAGALPNLVIIGAMKCGTTSLHHYLDLHPAITMSRPKELNFFIGPAAGAPRSPADDEPDWAQGNWHRGAAWYAAQFDPAATVRGEASPGYTSPSYPVVAERMARLIPRARLLYAVRDPIARAISQYEHHRRQGTEIRGLAEALLDPGSQYIARGRYFERLRPFLDTGTFGSSVSIVAQEELGVAPRAVLRALFEVLDVDGDYWSPAMAGRRNAAPAAPPHLGAPLERRLREHFRDDADRLRGFAGRDFPGWSV
jgi:hypothetical protein